MRSRETGPPVEVYGGSKPTSRGMAGSVRHDFSNASSSPSSQKSSSSRPEEDAFLLQLRSGFEDELSLTTEDHISELLREAVGQILYLESTPS